MDDLLNEFLVETSDRLVQLDPEIRRFETVPGDATIQSRLADLFHTIKGASGFLTLARLEVIAQAGEDLLAGLKSGVVPPTPRSALAIVTAADTIRRILTALAGNAQEPPGDDTDLLAGLREMSAPAVPASEVETARPSPAEPPREPPVQDRGAVAPPVPASVATIGSSVTVPTERLESIADLVGQLVQSRNNLNHLMSARDDSELEDSVRHLSNITSDLGAGIVATRRQALGSNAGERPSDFDIVTALTVACGGRRFAIPQRHVLELVWVTPTGGMGTANDEFRFLRLRDRRLPWIRLSTILDVELDRALARRREIVVMMRAGDEALGLSVEQVFDAEEIVVRAQPPVLKNVGLYSGNAILGDGSVAMVLDPSGLLAELQRRQQKALAERRAAALPAPQK